MIRILGTRSYLDKVIRKNYLRNNLFKSRTEE